VCERNGEWKSGRRRERERERERGEKKEKIKKSGKRETLSKSKR